MRSESQGHHQQPKQNDVPELAVADVETVCAHPLGTDFRSQRMGNAVQIRKR
jgi:hypothetical protein